MPRSRSDFALLWILAALGGLTAAAILGVTWHTLASYTPVTVEGLAPVSNPPENNINLHDGRVIEQSFVASERVVTHLGIGLHNVRGAAPTARLHVEVTDQIQQRRGDGQVSLAEISPDDITLVPAAFFLVPGERYHLRASTEGVPAKAALSVDYEGDARGYPEGEATLKSSGPPESVKVLPGNIRFQIIRLPTPRVLLDTWWHSTAGKLLTLYFVGLLVCLLPRVRKIITVHLPAPLHLVEIAVAWREAFFVTILGLALATIVTLPYFTNLHLITPSGDVQRALVYRAIARDALLHDGEIARWDAYLCGGVPLLANAESAHLDPFFLLVLLFGANAGARLSVTATLALGFVGAYYLARRFAHAAPIPAILAGALFSFSGFAMLAFANGNFAWMPFGWIPWFVYFYLRSLQEARLTLVAALVLAFIFFGGSIHMMIYALLAAAFLGLFLAVQTKSLRPLFVFLPIVAGLVSLVAIKLLPAASVQALSADWHRPPPFIQPLAWLPAMFWGRDQLSIPPWRFKLTGEYFRWIEYGAYVGIVPVILFVLGIPGYRRRPLTVAMFGAAALLLAMTFAFWPWTWLHRLPFLNEVLRNPQRARVVFLLYFGLLVAVAVTALVRRLPRRARLNISAAGVTLLLVDLVTFHASLYPHLFRLESPRLQPAEQFIRLTESYTVADSDYYKVGFENYQAGQGTTDLCIPYLVQRGIAARGVDSSNPATPYRGEAWLDEGEARLTAVRPNHLSVALSAHSDGWLYLNQNFFPGWSTTPPRTVANRDGLLAVRVAATDRDIQLSYTPVSYSVGRWLTLIALLVAALYLPRRPWFKSAV